MKAVSWIGGIFVITLIFFGAYYFSDINKKEIKVDITKTTSNQVSDSQNAFVIEEVVRGLDTPWGLAFLPDKSILVTERKGTVRLIDQSFNLREEPLIDLDSVLESGEGGLLGIAIHPKFSESRYVYLYYTYEESGENMLNRVSRFEYGENSLTNEKIMVDAIPGASNHNGGRIKFGPDGFLYITTGDAQLPSLAQNKESLAGKILRVSDSGDSAPDNPFGSRIFSFGHRNPQGITWDEQGVMWSTEHGPSGLETGNDELNRIVSGNNYGWPEIRGNEARSEMVTPILESGRGNTWAPGGLAYVHGKDGGLGKLYFVGLRGVALYEVTIDDGKALLKTYFKGELGRLRDIVTGPDGMLYITTSNRDGRGVPKSGDDKIYRINPEKLDGSI